MIAEDKRMSMLIGQNFVNLKKLQLDPSSVWACALMREGSSASLLVF